MKPSHVLCKMLYVRIHLMDCGRFVSSFFAHVPSHAHGTCGNMHSCPNKMFLPPQRNHLIWPMVLPSGMCRYDFDLWASDIVEASTLPILLHPSLLRQCDLLFWEIIDGSILPFQIHTAVPLCPKPWIQDFRQGRKFWLSFRYQRLSFGRICFDFPFLMLLFQTIHPIGKW